MSSVPAMAAASASARAARRRNLSPRSGRGAMGTVRAFRKRSSEILLHLAVYKNRPDVNGVVHCHPPHATAFAVAGVPIPQCILPEVEVFLGDVPTAVYETPGTQKFAETIVPHLKASNT